MDPASAFALACGVIQVIQASYGLINTTKQLHDRGSIEKSALLKDQISQTDRLLFDLDTGRAHAPSDEADQKEYGELLDLAANCDNSAQELLKLLRHFDVSGPHKAWKSLKMSPEIMWRMSTIEKLREKMDTYRELLDSRILASLWYVFTENCPVSEVVMITDQISVGRKSAGLFLNREKASVD